MSVPVPAAARGDAFAGDVPAAIREFLGVPSSPVWAQALAADVPTLLVDHANCELKAAASALSLLHRYPGHAAITYRMSRLAREELRHYEQVQKQMAALGVAMRPLSASRAAARRDEPARLVETLIVGALIEARSCERFALIAPLLTEPLAAFYRGLLASEARHFEHYLELARDAACGQVDVDAGIERLRVRERELIAAPADALRFHSGPPAENRGTV